MNVLQASQQFHDRIFCQFGSIIAIRVAAGDAENPLADHLLDGVLDFARLASIFDALGDDVGQSHLLLDGVQQDGSAVGAGVRSVESDHGRFREQIGKP